jgi:hypothetical protein
MNRTVKTIKDNNGNDVEVYADLCNVCSKEMIFPKADADKIEEMFPFIKEKITKGTPCLDCAKIQVENGTFSLYSNDELKEIKNKLIGEN